MTWRQRTTDVLADHFRFSLSGMMMINGILPALASVSIHSLTRTSPVLLLESGILDADAPLVLEVLMMFQPTQLSMRVPHSLMCGAHELLISVTDLPEAVYQYLLTCVSNLRPSLYFLVLRCALLLLVSTGLCAFTFLLLRCRSIAVQWAIGLVGVVIVLELPIQRLNFSRSATGWLFLASLYACIVIPWTLATLLVDTSGRRKRLATIIYVLEGLATLVSFWRTP